jgi:hypothetical protein
MPGVPPLSPMPLIERDVDDNASNDDQNLGESAASVAINAIYDYAEKKLTGRRHGYDARLTNIYSKKFTQSLASAATSVNGTASAINHVDERPETLVKRSVIR